MNISPTNSEETSSGVILLVEDDRPIRLFLQTVLQRAGYEVIAAADGLEALKVVMSQPVSAVITDAVMPHLSGHELCRFLRRHPQLSSLPLIMLSGLSDDKLRAEFVEKPDIYLTKPVSGKDLIDSLAGLIGQTA